MVRAAFDKGRNGPPRVKKERKWEEKVVILQTKNEVLASVKITYHVNGLKRRRDSRKSGGRGRRKLLRAG